MESRLTKNIARLVVSGLVIGGYYAVSVLFLCEAELDHVCTDAASNSSLVAFIITLVVAFSFRSTKQFFITSVTMVLLVAPFTHCATYYLEESEYAEVSRNFTFKIMNNLYRRLDEYNRVCGFYPSAEEGLEVLGKGSKACPGWKPRSNIMQNLTDAFGEPLIYEPNGSPANQFILRSLGADRAVGGQGDNEDIEMFSAVPGDDGEEKAPEIEDTELDANEDLASDAESDLDQEADPLSPDGEPVEESVEEEGLEEDVLEEDVPSEEYISDDLVEEESN